MIFLDELVYPYIQLFIIFVYSAIQSEAFKGGLAQMVERSVCIREAQGSMPWSSTFCMTG